MPLKLLRPLVFFDLETTGTSTQDDRIVEISIVKLFPDMKETVDTIRVNPEMAIPAEATQVHGISDKDVENCPKFREIAPQILKLIMDSDLCGYNMIRFDLPLLRMEFLRCGVEFNIEGIRLIDPMRIFMRKEPRDLTSALLFYCNENMENAHSAEADTLATKKILLSQLERYTDLPQNIEELAQVLSQGEVRYADINGKLVYNEQGELVFNFGKHRNKKVADYLDYARWMLSSDFPEDTKQVLRGLLQD